MKIKMVKTSLGSPDGIKVQQYEAGKVYDVPEELGLLFVESEVAKKVEREKKVEKVEEVKKKRGRLPKFLKE